MLSNTICCIQCGYKIIGRDARPGQGCPLCKVPMYRDGGEGTDFRISKAPLGGLFLQQSLDRRREERFFAVAGGCGLLAGMALIASLVWVAAHAL